MRSVLPFFGEEKFGDALDFTDRKEFSPRRTTTGASLSYPNEETVSGWFSGNPSGSVMTPPLRSPAMPSKPKNVRNNVRVFRRAMPLRAFQPTSHTTALSLQHALNCEWRRARFRAAQSVSNVSGVFFRYRF